MLKFNEIKEENDKAQIGELVTPIDSFMCQYIEEILNQHGTNMRGSDYLLKSIIEHNDFELKSILVLSLFIFIFINRNRNNNYKY